MLAVHLSMAVYITALIGLGVFKLYEIFKPQPDPESVRRSLARWLTLYHREIAHRSSDSQLDLMMEQARGFAAAAHGCPRDERLREEACMAIAVGIARATQRFGARGFQGTAGFMGREHRRS